MGNMRRLPDGQDFSAEHFAKEKDFGFSGSAEGYDEHPVGPPFAGSKPDSGPHHSVETTPGYAHGGHTSHLHPHGHQVTHVEMLPHGVVHHHKHGGMTVHHHDGHVSHHDAHGGAVHHGHMGHHGDHPGEGTHVAKLMEANHAEPDGDEGMAHGGHASSGRPPRIPRSLKPKADFDRSPINTPPRNPQRSPTQRNAMPGGQMPYGVEPSAEPDEAGSEQGIPQLSHGGKPHHKSRGGAC